MRPSKLGTQPVGILCLGTTPAWQRTMRVDRLVPGQVNRAVEVLEYASGKPINVARVVLALGARPILITPLGGERGSLIRRELAGNGIELAEVVVAAETRMCVTLVDCSTGGATELVEEATALPPQTANRLLDELRTRLRGVGAAGVVMSGSVVAGLGVDFYARAIAIARQHGARTILDTRGQPLIQALPAGPDIVKLNQAEVQETLGMSPDSQALRELFRHGAGRVVVTRGADGCDVFDGMSLTRHAAPKVRTVNAVGSGDAFAAGLAVALASGLPWDDAVALALACGAANAATLRAGEVSLEHVMSLCRGTTGAAAALEQPHQPPE